MTLVLGNSLPPSANAVRIVVDWDFMSHVATLLRPRVFMRFDTIMKIGDIGELDSVRFSISNS